MSTRALVATMLPEADRGRAPILEAEVVDPRVGIEWVECAYCGRCVPRLHAVTLARTWRHGAVTTHEMQVFACGMPCARAFQCMQGWRLVRDDEDAAAYG